MDLAAGYQHFADGAPFAEIALRHPSVKEVYFPWVDEPSGRPKLGYEEEDDKEELALALRRDLTSLREAGVRLDLLLNANCYGAEAMSKKLEGRVIDIITKLQSWNCKPEIVTTASPFIARTLKKAFPGIEIRASVNMRLTTLQAFRYLAPLFDSYYLGRDVQRNLETVRRFSDWCHANGKQLCILANSGCLRNCPWQTYHDNLIAHSDAAMKVENVKGWSPHLCWTLYRDPKNFAEILKATWIRPEDLPRYEPYVDVVKLATRRHPAPEKIIAAYATRTYDGNLAELMDAPHVFPKRFDNRSFDAVGELWTRVRECPHANDCTHCGACGDLMKEVFK